MNLNQMIGNDHMIKSQRLAGWLMLHGQKLHNIKESTDGSNRNVFYFSNNKSLNDLICKYNAGKRASDQEYEHRFNDGAVGEEAD